MQWWFAGVARVGATPSPARGSPGTGCLRGGTQPWTLTDMTFLKFVAIYVSSSRSFCTLPNFASPPLLRRPPSLYLLFRFDFSAGLVPLLSRFARLWPTSLSPSLSFPLSPRPFPLSMPRDSRVDFIFPSPSAQTRSLRSLRRREAPLPSTRHARAFISCRPSCRPFFVRAQPRLLFHSLFSRHPPN